MQQESLESPGCIEGNITARRIRHFCSLLTLAVLISYSRGRLLAQTQVVPAESSQMRQLHQALALAEHGDTQKALALANQLVEQHPAFVSALKLQGMILEQTGQREAAAESYEKGLKLAPNDADLLFKVGVFQLVAGDKEEAIKLFLHHLRLQPKDGDALYYLAQAYRLTHQDDLALKAIKDCLKLEPNNPSVWQKYGELLCITGDNETGLTWLLKAQQADATLDQINLDIGIASMKTMDFQSAQKYAGEAVKTHPNDIRVLELLASADVKLSQWADAKQIFERILTYKKDDIPTLLELGHCEVELKEYQTAVETLEDLLHIDPTPVLAHFYLSRAYAGLGKTAEAQHEAKLHQLMMEKLSFSRSTDSDLRESGIRAQARQLLTEHRESEVLRLYQDRFKGTSPTLVADSYVFAGKIYLYMGDTEHSLISLRRALEIEPKVRGAHTYEGILAIQQNDLAKAEHEFEAELANDPNYQEAIAEMGEVRYRQGRWADAAAQLDRSKTMTPELLYMLCDSDFRMGKVEDANLTAETVAIYGRNNSKLMQALVDLVTRNKQPEEAQRLSTNLAQR